MTLLEDLTPATSSTQIQEKLSQLQTWLAAQLPDIDVLDPVLIAVVLNPWVRLLVENENKLSAAERLARASINSLSDVPPKFQESAREFVADLHGVSQSSATTASGELKLVVSSDRTIIMGAGTRFKAGSITFTTVQPYVLQNSQSPVTAASRVYLPAGANQWYVTIPVVAELPGVDGNIPSGTHVTALESLPSVAVSLTANANFIGGTNSNSIAWILSAIRQETFSRTLGTRDQIVAWMANNPLLGGVRQVGVIGFGDEELVRDYHPVLPLQRAGLADFYIATSYYPAQHTVTLEAVVKTSSSTSTTLSVDIGRSISPGFLRVDKITDVLTGAAATLLTESRGLDLTPTYNQQTPVLTTPYHGGFSAFQTATVEFSIPTTGLLTGTKRMVSVTLLRVAGLDIAQSLVSSRNVRSLAGDVLVRAAIPMLVNLRIQLQSQFETLTPDVAAMQLAVSQEFDIRPMRDRVATSDIVRAIMPYLPDDLSVSNILFDAELILPDGTTRRITSVGVLECPIDKSLQLSPRTVAFYCNPSNVQITQDRLLTPSTP